MKRKRRNKKGKKKGASTVIVASEAAVDLVDLEKEDNSGADENDDGDDNNDNSSNNEEEEEEEYNEDGDEDNYKNDEQQNDSVMEVDTPSSTGTDQPMDLASVKPDALIDKTAEKSVGLVKVKLKTSKALESQSDTDKSSLQVGLEKQVVANDKMEETGNSESEVKGGISGTVSKKPGSIKIKSSKVLGGSTVEKCSYIVMSQDEILKQKEPRTPCQESPYNKQELDSSLSVIMKVMKMDAAEPFNVPVNPEDLGIPDYFDVIDTPMDFGTICSNLEKGDKYMNSEDVYKDVQFIWDNCYKYNNKGDYILDLMRRVKKNFMKYWTAAGLFTEQSKGSSGEGVQGDDTGASSKGQGKGSQLKHKKKKGHGRRHKFDCLCAICVLKRRRREREENARLAKGQTGLADSKLAQEGSLLIESPGGENSISNMDESLDQEADAEVEGVETKLEETEQQYSSGKEKHEEPDEEDDEEEEEDEENEMEIGIQKKGKAETSENVEAANRSGERVQQSQIGSTEDAGAVIRTHTQKVHVIGQHEERTAEFKHNMQKESEERQQKKAKMYDKFRSENPLLLSLCETLFPNNRRSLWSGPQSLFQQQGSVPTSSIHATIETLMKDAS